LFAENKRTKDFALPSFTLHVQPPHLYNVGASLPFEKRFVAMPAEGVRFIEDVQRDQAIVQVQQSLRDSLSHFVKCLVRRVHLLAIRQAIWDYLGFEIKIA